MKKVWLLSLLCAIAAAVFAFVPATSAAPWKFGVLSDTQWVTADDGKNPYQSAVDIINQANAAFIANNVQFVIAVGDLADTSTYTTPITSTSPDGTTYTGLNAAVIAATCAASPLCSGNFTPAPYAPGFFPAGTFASGATYNTGPTWSVGVAGQAIRAISAQALYNAGIGFFPLRGNHDDSQGVAGWFQYVYPQTQNGLNNATPADVYTVPNPEPSTFTVPTQSGSTFQIGSNFSGPTSSLGLTGLSYAFTANNAAFVLIDQFTPLTGAASAIPNAGGGEMIDDQQTWISSVLQARSPTTHAFVFSHKGLITEDHVDVLFGSNPSKDPTGTDAFITALATNGVRFYINGHDHMHDHSRIYTTDGVSHYVTELTCASNSNKFYTPNIPANDVTYDVPAFGHTRQVEISQELYYIPYYIVTVDGPKVTFDYYAVNSNGNGSNIPTTPTLTGNWQKRETFGYSLNGKEFMIAQGSSYTTVSDSVPAGVDAYNSIFFGTSAQILGGTNGSTVKDHSGRPLTKAVNTGWAPRTFATLSDSLTLWGMTDVAASNTDTYALSMTYDPSVVVNADRINAGHGVVLAAQDANGNWVQAGSKKFKLGPYEANYPLGTYGVNPATNTAWAVVNQSGTFAVIQTP
jgi:hypothetical protein